MLIEQDTEVISIRSVDMGKDSGDFLTYYFRANCEWVSSVWFGTGASGLVQSDLAQCIESAQSNARVGTFLLNTCSIGGTFAVYMAFGSTIGWRSYEGGQTGAGGCIISGYRALRVQSTRWGVTRVPGGFYVRCCWRWKKEIHYSFHSQKEISQTRQRKHSRRVIKRTSKRRLSRIKSSNFRCLCNVS